MYYTSEVFNLHLKALWRLFPLITALIEPRYLPLLECAGRHYLVHDKLRCHTCWSHRGRLQYQTQSWSHSCCSRSRCFQGYQSLLQSFSLFPRIPILALDHALWIPTTLNPSLLQLSCNEALDPICFFHALRPNEVGRYLLSAISEYRELAGWLMTKDLKFWPIFIPREILLNGVFQ